MTARAMRDIKRCLAVLALTFCSMTNVFATDAIRPTTSACSMTAVPADSLQATADSTGNVNAEKKTAVPKDTTANVNTNVDFNPQLYKMQKRHLEKNDSLSTDLLERFSVAIHTGARKIKPQGARDVKVGVPIGLSATYQIHPYHQARLSMDYVQYQVPDELYSLHHTSVRADYLFDLMSYINGYKRYRLFNVSPAIGAGVTFSSFGHEVKSIMQAQAGLRFGVRLGYMAEAFVEPYAALTGDGIDHSNNTDLSGYDVLFGLHAGISMPLYRRTPVPLKTAGHNGHLFFEISQGFNFFHNNSLPLMPSTGTALQIAVGKWFDPSFGLRLSGNFTDNYWGSSTTAATESQPAYETHYKESTAALRLEAVFNPLAYVRKLKDSPFALNIAVGGEIGRIIKSMPENMTHLHCGYTGLTASLQALYNIGGSTWLFIDPRYLMASYTIPYSNVYGERNFKDKSMSINIGVRLQKGNHTPEEQDLTAENPKWTAGVYGGGLKFVRADRPAGDRSPQFQAGAEGGYRFTPLHGVSVRIGWQRLSVQDHLSYSADYESGTHVFTSLWRNNYDLLNARIAYSFNFSNWYQRQDTGRRLDVYLLCGPSFSAILRRSSTLYSKEIQAGDNKKIVTKERSGTSSLGCFAAVRTGYALTKNISVFAEPSFNLYFKKDFLGVKKNLMKNTDGLMELSAGVSYSF